MELLWRKVFFRWSLPVVLAIIGVHLAGSWGDGTASIDLLAIALVSGAWIGVLFWPEKVALYAGYLVDAAILVALLGGVCADVFFSNPSGFEVLQELAFWAPVVSVYWVTIYFSRPVLPVLFILILYSGILWGDWVGFAQHGKDNFPRIVFSYAAQAILLVSLMRLFSIFQHRERALQEELNQAVDNALRDPLTQLPNRRFFDEELMRGCERAARDGTRLSIIIADIDHFKDFNDRYGHSEGDEILKTVARIIGERIRISDWACRWGGEEFAIILHNTDIVHASYLAEELRLAFASYYFKDEMRLTISLGVSEFRDGDSPNDVFDRADGALYRAKSLGRNRVEIG